MAETSSPIVAPASSGSALGSAFDKLLAAGSSIYSGYTNAQIAKTNAAALKAAAPSVVAQQSSNVTKYVLIGVAVVVGAVVLIFVLKRK